MNQEKNKYNNGAWKRIADNVILKEISTKLDSLIILSAINAFKDKSMTDQVGLLAELGFTNPVIAKIIGTSSGSVKSMKSLYKKKTEK